jgi:virulence-associated protein VapD
MESDLEQIEKYAEIKEQQRLDELEQQRKEIASEYSEFMPFGVNLRTISNDDFDKLLNGAKLQYQAKIEGDKKAEIERIENQRLDDLARERQLQIAPYAMFLNSNVSLREMSDEDYMKLFNDLQVARFEFEKEQEKIRIENEELKKQAQIIEQQKIIAQQQAEAKLKAEQDARLKIELELQEKKNAEIKAEQERLAEIKRQEQEAKKLLKSSEKNQLKTWVQSFEDIKIPEHLKESETANEILNKYWAFNSWAKKQIENI